MRFLKIKFPKTLAFVNINDMQFCYVNKPNALTAKFNPIFLVKIISAQKLWNKGKWYWEKRNNGHARTGKIEINWNAHKHKFLPFILIWFLFYFVNKLHNVWCANISAISKIFKKLHVINIVSSCLVTATIDIYSFSSSFYK